MKKFYVGVKAIIKDYRGFLVLKSRGNYYDIPGGRIDGDESFEETIKREVAEELPGTEVLKVKELLGAYRVDKDLEDNTGLVLLYFLVDANLPKTIVLSDEHESFLWVKRKSQLPKGLNKEATRIIFQQLV